jgi:hypothetical protein
MAVSSLHSSRMAPFKSRNKFILATLEPNFVYIPYELRELFEKFADWRQYAAVMQREAVTVIQSRSGGGM